MNFKVKCKHSAFMKKAGFRLHEEAMRVYYLVKPKKPYLVYWINDDKIIVTCFSNESISLKQLVSKVTQQARYWTRKSAKIVFNDPQSKSRNYYIQSKNFFS